jgi:hypothetical protein
MPYKVLHLGVGLYRQNDIVTEDQLHAHGGESGIDMDRLFNLGAIEETDEEPTVPNMENPENQIFRTSTGDTVDYPGSDRPTVAAIAREKSTKVLSPKDRVKLFARKGKAEGDGTPGGPTEGPVGATRSTAAMREQREKGLVPEFRESEIADYEEVEEHSADHAEADRALLEENEPVPEPDEVQAEEAGAGEEAVVEEEVPSAPPAKPTRKVPPQKTAARRK